MSSTAAADFVDEHEPPIRVIAIRDLLYCERLFYLTEVENIQCPNEFIFAGRRLHGERVPEGDETPELRSFELSSEAWGLKGKVDAVRRRDGAWVAYEHKKGRCRREEEGRPLAWPSDRIQAVAYAVLVEEALGEPVMEARIRYHADNVTACVEVDDAARKDLRQAIERARELRASSSRPPVTDNERLCSSCSLAPVCLPAEERLAARPVHQREPPSQQPKTNGRRSVVPLPADRQKETLHVTNCRAYVTRSAETLVIKAEDQKQTVPIAAKQFLDRIRESLQRLESAATLDSLRGLEVMAANAYFAALPCLLVDRIPQELRPIGAREHIAEHIPKVGRQPAGQRRPALRNQPLPMLVLPEADARTFATTE